MVQMKREDFGGGLFDGMEFQREIERRAFYASFVCVGNELIIGGWQQAKVLSVLREAYFFGKMLYAYAYRKVAGFHFNSA